ncbi:MAG TPA: (2Fe-2S) ferredoxin domain-containing protein [Phycisphaerae bacterium]|nr:(2Fe-2S) ferredoxin domain-containing protein [Phycisphaerae bacterium]HOJ75131.1 (2Fe-2S) ferredoxin domain-containing protein [Phycisphaerae bacterium]HOM52361.1 (2Fe-2S) ferredoxin domain-containing protein [Phycisphaerae bacterium]HON64940.1 (2Fe-2S) ferredoxin domain-containing protein [Phycisphaerae bacterium]HOQ87945.1 (2Fe-2S) ferredoxin domain-containing protein [Phycisphaerae bacterium]
MPGFEKHVFVCTNVRDAGHPRGCCAARGGEAVREALKAAVKTHNLARRVRINGAGCLDQCEHGPVIVVYPEGVWYGFVTPQDVPEIVESHLLGGKPVERLRLPDTCINTPRCPHKGRAAGIESRPDASPAESSNRLTQV